MAHTTSGPPVVYRDITRPQVLCRRLTAEQEAQGDGKARIQSSVPNIFTETEA